MKDFLVYTVLRLLLFVACYAAFAGLWAAVAGRDSNAFVWPFVAAVIVSSVLSLKFLQGPRERFARRVEARADKATARFEAMRSREDADQNA